MKARIENNKIVLYGEVPKSFVNDDVNIIGGFDLLSKEELEQYGFFDVIEPILPEGKMYGELFWDSFNDNYTYTIVDVPIPPLPPKKIRFTKFEFLSKFTMDEKVSIYNLESSNVYVKIWLDTFRVCDEIDITNKDVIDGLTMLKTLGIINDARQNEILN